MHHLKLNKQDAKLLHDVRWSWAEANNNPKLQAFKYAMIGARCQALSDEIDDLSTSELRETLYDAYTGGCKAVDYAEAVDWLVEIGNDNEKEIEDHAELVKYLLPWLTTD